MYPPPGRLLTRDSMQIEQSQWLSSHIWSPEAPGTGRLTADLVLVFGSRAALQSGEALAAIHEAYPAALVAGCSTAGEICDTRVLDDSVVVTAVGFDRTRIRGELATLDSAADSYAVGQQLAEKLPHQDLAHVLVLSVGLDVNGSELVRGLTQHLPKQVTATGGLAGDGPDFKETMIVFNGELHNKAVAVIGFYGSGIKVGYGSLGGWDSFGPERVVTRAEANVLFELDGRSALELYKEYLGEHAHGLPGTGLLFPLSIRTQNGSTSVVRTILSVDEAAGSMTFAGDIPVGAYARLMKANFDRLIDGAADAARTSYQAVNKAPVELAILISCVGRKMVLKQRTEEEVEGVREVLGPNPVLTGFYSYGEVSPFTPNAKCELHNQTMTITTFSEQ